VPNHLRRQIREAAAAALTGLGTTGANVFESRTHELQDINLPGLRIYTNDETVAIGSKGASRTLARELELVVEGCSKKSSGLDDELDAIVKEVEVAIAANQSIGGAKYVQLRRIEIDMEGEAEKEVGVARMTFEVLYYAQIGTPDVAM
jgi:hypothetical protein